jgi:transcription elongation factor Elf1
LSETQELVDVWRQERFELRNRYRCPHCLKKSKTESMHESFRDYDKKTQQLWSTCQHCRMDFQIQGKRIIQKAAIPTHKQCLCGRHFLFFNERDVQLIRFSKFLGSPFVWCPYCRRKVLLFTPETPVRYWLSVAWQRLRIQVARQRRAFRRAQRGEA